MSLRDVPRLLRVKRQIIPLHFTPDNLHSGYSSQLALKDRKLERLTNATVKTTTDTQRHESREVLLALVIHY